MGTLYIDTTGSATNSGSNDGAAVASGSAATVAGDVVSLDGSPDLSGLITSGDNQSAIHLNDATNTYRKIFWITDFNNTSKTVTVDVAPTGITSSAWTIGGRHVLTSASIEGALRPGDTAIFNNSPASQSAPLWTFRNSGTVTGGYCKVIGKAGVRPLLVSTASGAIDVNSLLFCWVENLELQTSHATSHVISFGSNASQSTIYNVKMTSSVAGDGASISGAVRMICCEISGCGGNGFRSSGGGLVVSTYIHDNGGNGAYITNNNPISYTAYNIIANNSGYGVEWSTTAATSQTVNELYQNIIYGNAGGGLHLQDADLAIQLTGNVIAENGQGSGLYNVNAVAGSSVFSLSRWNDYYHSGVGGGSNFNNWAASAFDITSDPLFTDPDNGDFSLGASSPLKGAGLQVGTDLSSNNNIGAIMDALGSGGAMASRIFLGM